MRSRAWDRVHGGGDRLALVLQNEGLGAIGGTGNNLGTSDSDDRNFTRGIRDVFAIEVQTFQELGFVARSCSRNRPISLNATGCFDTVETSVPIYTFDKLDP